MAFVYLQIRLLNETHLLVGVIILSYLASLADTVIMFKKNLSHGQKWLTHDVFCVPGMGLDEQEGRQSAEYRWRQKCCPGHHAG